MRTEEQRGGLDRSYFFDEGLRFSCTGCGQCCTGAPGVILFTEEEGRRMATRMGMAEEAFLEAYAYRYGKGYSLKERENGDCVFLEGVRCGIYEARPSQCRTYPFWPEIVRSEAAWRKTSRECPGIGQGDLITKEEILRRLQEALEACEDF
ncbi:MAG TPA: YkgJ family cysteine cluster protein [Kiritimatiellia bacterium]|nr:YkgJ family cysteine cluster protein [Kiritimatiellia bacterium]